MDKKEIARNIASIVFQTKEDYCIVLNSKFQYCVEIVKDPEKTRDGIALTVFNVETAEVEYYDANHMFVDETSFSPKSFEEWDTQHSQAYGRKYEKLKERILEDIQ